MNYTFADFSAFNDSAGENGGLIFCFALLGAAIVIAVIAFVGWSLYRMFRPGYETTHNGMTIQGRRTLTASEKRHRMIFNPLTFVLAVICFPLWPLAVGVGIIWLFTVWAKDWGKGGHYAAKGFYPLGRPTCDVCYSAKSTDGLCPRCHV